MEFRKVLLVVIILSINCLLLWCEKSIKIDKYDVIDDLTPETITFSWSYVNDFENLYKNDFDLNSPDRISAITDWELVTIWNNMYKYSFSENWKYPFINVLFEDNDYISEEDIEYRDKENGEAWIEVKKLQLYWLYNWFSLQNEDNARNYSLLKCEFFKGNNILLPYWTWIIEIDHDKKYYYNNHITWWSYIDLSKFINHITTYMWDNLSDCVVEIWNIFQFWLVEQLPFTFWNELDWEIAILVDSNQKFWCNSSAWKWNIELIFITKQLLCSMEVHGTTQIKKIY